MARGEPGFRLGIDYGTSNTTAILRWPDGRTRPLLFDGSTVLPSAVYVEPNGRIAVGRDAVHASREDPARLEPTPMRRVDDGSVVLSGTRTTISRLVAVALRRVWDEAARVSGTEDLDVTLTHPAGWWGASRRSLLSEAANQARLAHVQLVPEPVAAAAYFVDVLGRDIPEGSALVVYDFGGGTFKAAAVARAADGYDVLAVDGLDDVGGVDLDAALLDLVLRRHLVDNPEVSHRLDDPQTTEDRLHRCQLQDDVRAAKERLSRTPSAPVGLPLLRIEVGVTRDELDAVAGPVIERTILTAATVVRWAKLAPERVAGVLLVGGCSRIPLVADVLRRGIALTPTMVDSPETVVAEGSVRVALDSSRRSGAITSSTPPRHSLPIQIHAKPAQYAPEQSALIQAASVQPLPVQPLPLQPLPVQPLHVQPVRAQPDQPGPAHPAPAHKVPSSTVAAETVPNLMAVPPAERPPVDPWASRADLAPVTDDLLHDVPTYPVAVAPPVRTTPMAPRPMHQYAERAPSVAYQEGLHHGRPPRRWLTVIATVAVVAALTTTAALVVPRVIGGRTTPRDTPTTPQAGGGTPSAQGPPVCARGAAHLDTARFLARLRRPRRPGRRRGRRDQRRHMHVRRCGSAARTAGNEWSQWLQGDAGGEGHGREGRRDRGRG